MCTLAMVCWNRCGCVLVCLFVVVLFAYGDWLCCIGPMVVGRVGVLVVGVMVLCCCYVVMVFWLCYCDCLFLVWFGPLRSVYL